MAKKDKPANPTDNADRVAELERLVEHLYRELRVKAPAK